jgi:hypothetical protein
MSGVEGSQPHLRCHHCGRHVGATMHTRSTYRVDYYTLHTGDVEPTTMARSDDPSDVVTVMRLVRACEIVTCVDCYRRPPVRRARELLFRSELRAQAGGDAGT